MNIIPFEQFAPATTGAANPLAKKFLSINSDVHQAAQHATLSIKGKKFTISKDGLKKTLTKVDEEGETVNIQAISLTVLRANMKSRAYYSTAFDDEKSEGQRPTCQSFDGIAPDASSLEPQAKKCQICPHAVWGSKTGDLENGKGTACAQKVRLAVAAPDKPEEALLLNVPPASIKSFREAVKMGEQRQLPYNQLVMRVSFDREATAPKLVFKPTGVLDDAAFEKAAAMYENDVVLSIVGLSQIQHAAPAEEAKALPAPAKEDPAAELEAALEAKRAASKALAAAKAVSAAELDEEEAGGNAVERVVASKKKAAAKPAEEAPVEKKAAKPAASDEGSDNLLDDLNSLLGGLDD